ncbi:hypothetical protein BC829DRAFT_414977 [Chytridium lagenaria]|nr:hypothetical protein BC829DRAFT_414977 [Chytridium lagenaria]
MAALLDADPEANIPDAALAVLNNDANGIPPIQAANLADDRDTRIRELEATIAALHAAKKGRVPVNPYPLTLSTLANGWSKPTRFLQTPASPPLTYPPDFLPQNIDLFIQAFSRFRNDATSFVLMDGAKPAWLHNRESIYDQLAIVHRIGIECHCLVPTQENAWQTLNRGHHFKLADDSYSQSKPNFLPSSRLSDG